MGNCGRSRHWARVAFVGVAMGGHGLLGRFAVASSPPSLRELLVATARGGDALRSLLRRPRAPELLSAKDDHGFCALAVAAYNGDVESAELLLEAGARVEPGEMTVFIGESPSPIASVVELLVRRSSMLVMLGTHFALPPYLHEARKTLVTSRMPSPGDTDVPNIARTLELLMHRGGARPTEKSLEEGSDLARAAYFIDADVVDVLAAFTGEAHASTEVCDARWCNRNRAAGRALVAVLLGVAQLKHRLNRALLSQPRMAGRMFRDYYGFAIESEAALLDPALHGFSFADTVRFVEGRAARAVQALLDRGHADPNFRLSKQSQKMPLHLCAEHGLTAIAELLIAARADLGARNGPFRRSPLHAAVIHRSSGVVRSILAAHGDATQVDSTGRDALAIARMLRWVDGQVLLGAPAAAVVPVLGRPAVVAMPELLSSAWHARLVREGSISKWSEGASDCGIDLARPWELTATRFVEEYLAIRRPLLIRGGAEHMPAMERWTNLRYLKRKAGATRLSAVTTPYPESFGDLDARDTQQVSLGDYIDRVMGRVNSTSGTPLYVFAVVERDDNNFKKLLKLVEKDAGPHPHWVYQDEAASKVLFRFGNIQFGLGPSGSGAPQHYHTHAYASLFSGRKRWWFFPPPHSMLSRKHAVKFAAEDEAARRALRPPPRGDKPAIVDVPHIVCDQAPGDIVYVPSEWGHLTLNQESTTVSVSREFSWDSEEIDSRVINALQI